MAKRTLDHDAKAVVAAFEATPLPADPVFAPLSAALERLKLAVRAEQEAASYRARLAYLRKMTPEQRATLAAKHRRLAEALEPENGQE